MSLPDWKGLLKWSLQQVPENPTTTKKPMAKEDVEFLQKAMESVHDHDKKVQSAAQLIMQVAMQKDDHCTVDELLSAFETMELFYEEHPGNASAVHKTGMLDALVEHVRQANHKTVAAALSLLTTTLSNNDKVQEAAASGPLMQYLLQMRKDVNGTPIEPKLITTIAAAIRHCANAESHFVKIGGMQYLIQCTSKSNPKVKEKAALLIYHFVNLKKLNRQDAQRMQLLHAVRNLMPLNVAAQGIQYAEVCINLFAAVILKYPGAFNKQDAITIAQQLSDAVREVPELEGAKDALREVHSALRG